MEIAFSEKISPHLMSSGKRAGFQAAICRRVTAGK